MISRNSDIGLLSETKIDETLPNTHFKIELKFSVRTGLNMDVVCFILTKIFFAENLTLIFCKKI